MSNRLIEDRTGLRSRIYGRERAILVGVVADRSPEEREIMEELVELSRTAGVDVLRVVTQRRDRPDPSTFIGEGKAQQLQKLAEESGADAIVFNDSLTPAQGRNLEDRIGVKVIDRAQLILDIFAQRAESKESKLQVELAQLEYLLPRLRGWGEALGQMGAGIGTRGPGETRLEMERQTIEHRIHDIKDRLEQAAKERRLRRKRRDKRAIPEIALIGYTNTGKSTLLQALCHTQTRVENKLFATLSPKVRQATLPDERHVVFVDTVGFIRKLPHQLVPAFRATLESAQDADLLVNVLDASSRSVLEQARTIQAVLSDLFGDKPRPPMLHVLNKVDRLTSDDDLRRLREVRMQLSPLVEVAAIEGLNVDGLLNEVSRLLASHRERVRVEIPYKQAGLVEKLHDWGRVHDERYEDERIVIEADLDEAQIGSLEKLSRENGLRLTRAA